MNIWELSEEDRKRANKELFQTEAGLMVEAEDKGIYDYQMVDEFFSNLTNYQKLKVFLYGQWAHDRNYGNRKE